MASNLAQARNEVIQAKQAAEVRCGVGKMLINLPSDDAEYLRDEILPDLSLTAVDIAKILQRAFPGSSLSRQIIQVHRRGACSCPPQLAAHQPKLDD